jgi:hypothetical protein
MSKFKTALEQTLKHWPMRCKEDDELMQLLAKVFSQAGIEEEEIEKVCSLFSDELDDAFARGQYSVLRD